MDSPIKFAFSQNILNQSRQSASISSKPSPSQNPQIRGSYNPSYFFFLSNSLQFQDQLKGAQLQFNVESQQNKVEARMETISQMQFIQQSHEKFLLTFNKNPLASLKELEESTTQEIALILHSESQISKTKLGELFGSPDEKAQEIFKEYLKVINFKNQAFDEALRRLLELIKLPKEAQQIDRIVYNFAEDFNRLLNFVFETIFVQRQNDEYFKVKEDGYVLGYAILMLQTSLHNDKVKENDRMTLEQFIKNTKGATSGLSDDQLKQIYERVNNNKFETQTSVVEQTYEELIDCEAKEGTELLKLAVKLERGDGFLKFNNSGKCYQNLSQIMKKASQNQDLFTQIWKKIKSNEKVNNKVSRSQEELKQMMQI